MSHLQGGGWWRWWEGGYLHSHGAQLVPGAGYRPPHPGSMEAAVCLTDVASALLNRASSSSSSSSLQVMLTCWCSWRKSELLDGPEWGSFTTPVGGNHTPLVPRRLCSFIGGRVTEMWRWQASDRLRGAGQVRLYKEPTQRITAIVTSWIHHGEAYCHDNCFTAQWEAGRLQVLITGQTWLSLSVNGCI